LDANIFNLPPPVKIVLASKSPRRHELLWGLGLNFTLFISEAEEIYPDDMSMRMVPSYLSARKAEEALKHLKFDELLIAADTIVLFENRIFGKPENESEAIAMLNALSGNMHEVITGVTLCTREKEFTFSEMTRVYFRRLPEDIISHYVKKFQPFDKAGGYAIQEWIGLVGIEKISGCFYNVMGLPVSRLVKELKNFGLDITDLSQEASNG
jgi:septum formation protein